MAQETISCEPFKPSTAFHNMTCWHFISPHFLRASFAVIFLVLTSSLTRWSALVKRAVLCTVPSLWRRGKKSALGLSSATGNTHICMEFSETIPRKPLYAIRLIHTWCALLGFWSCFLKWSWCLVHWIYRARVFGTAWDQAPHLVYLTSWVGHSVSVSVSLSNTPSEVSLVYKLRSPHKLMCQLHGVLC